MSVPSKPVVPLLLLADSHPLATAAMVEQQRLDHAHGLRAAERELERLQEQARTLLTRLQYPNFQDIPLSGEDVQSVKLGPGGFPACPSCRTAPAGPRRCRALSRLPRQRRRRQRLPRCSSRRRQQKRRWSPSWTRCERSRLLPCVRRQQRSKPGMRLIYYVVCIQGRGVSLQHR